MIIKDVLYTKILKNLKTNLQYVKKVIPYLDNKPFLDPNIAKRIKALKEINVPTVNITTNTNLMNTKHIKNILKTSLDEIYISINSLKPKVFEEIQKKLNFNNVIENTHLLIKEKDRINSHLKIRMQIILQKLNFEEKDEFIRY